MSGNKILDAIRKNDMHPLIIDLENRLVNYLGDTYPGRIRTRTLNRSYDGGQDEEKIRS